MMMKLTARTDATTVATSSGGNTSVNIAPPTTSESSTSAGASTRAPERRRNRRREDQQEPERRDDRQGPLVASRGRVDIGGERWDQHRGHRQQHQRRDGARTLAVEALDAVAQAADEERETEHEQ